MTDVVFRVQAIDGCGPYRPGFSATWVTPRELPPSWMEEFGLAILQQRRTGEVFGCAFRTLEQARKWFLQDELARLRVLGYHLVRIEVDRIVAESAHQVVFARTKPLAMDVETVE